YETSWDILDEDPEGFKEIRKVEASIDKYEKILLECRSHQAASPLSFAFGADLERDPLWLKWSPSLSDQQKRAARRHCAVATTVVEAHHKAAEAQRLCTALHDHMKSKLKLDHQLSIRKTRNSRFLKPPVPVRNQDEEAQRSSNPGPVSMSIPVGRGGFMANHSRSNEARGNSSRSSEQQSMTRREEKTTIRPLMVTPDFGDPDGSDPNRESDRESDRRSYIPPRRSTKPVRPQKPVCPPVAYEDSSDESQLDWLPDESEQRPDAGREARKWAGPFMQVVGVYDPRKDKAHEFRSWRDKFRGQADIFRLSQRDQFSMLDTLL
ncbi:MAG: hypothetical protein GY696_01000, partial [Gammaproteobacteria bacterium]|nr:hypothetical protein [Gammaproteobacteria bacterium]